MIAAAIAPVCLWLRRLHRHKLRRTQFTPATPQLFCSSAVTFRGWVKRLCETTRRPLHSFRCLY